MYNYTSRRPHIIEAQRRQQKKEELKTKTANIVLAIMLIAIPVVVIMSVIRDQRSEEQKQNYSKTHDCTWDYYHPFTKMAREDGKETCYPNSMYKNIKK